jgi:hypothetical protein
VSAKIKDRWILDNILLLIGAGDLLIAVACVFCGPFAATWWISGLFVIVGVFAIFANYGLRRLSRP